MLSIIIVHFNTFDLTRTCLDSLAKYVDVPDFEVILVSNGEGDRPIDELLHTYAFAKVIRNKVNVGFSKAVNIGLAVSKGDYVLLLNSDVEFVEGGFNGCIRRLIASDEVGVLGCRLLFQSGKLQHSANDFPSVRTEIIELLRLNVLFPQRFSLNGFYFDHLSEREVDWVWGTFFLMPRHVLSVFPDGVLPDTFFMYFEDVLWCYEMKRHGLKVLYYPNYSVTHHSGGSSSAAFVSERKLQLLIENEKLFLSQTRGRVYMIAVYFLRALKFLSLRKREFINLSGRYLRAALW